MNLEAILEGVLFLVGDEGISLKAICEIMEIEEEVAKKTLKELKTAYEKENRGLKISYLGDAFKLTTKEEHKEYLMKLADNPETNTLSNVALETLAIIAYNQPVTRIEVDNIRGVQSGHMIRTLAAKGLIEKVGSSDLPGRPHLYGTTKEFLDYFGLPTIGSLPKFKKETLESDENLFTSIYKEEN